MNWIFYVLVVAAILHVLEEYVFPGGFLDFMKQMVPTFAPFVTVPFTVIINGLFLILCLAAAMVGPRQPVFSLSVASLCGLNGVMHLGGTARMQQYTPGVLTGVLLYLPLAVWIYYLVVSSGEVSTWQVVGSVLLGVVYQLVPLGTLGLAYGMKHI